MASAELGGRGEASVAAEERKVVVGERRGETPLGRLVAMQGSYQVLL